VTIKRLEASSQCPNLRVLERRHRVRSVLSADGVLPTSEQSARCLADCRPHTAKCGTACCDWSNVQNTTRYSMVSAVTCHTMTHQGVARGGRARTQVGRCWRKGRCWRRGACAGGFARKCRLKRQLSPYRPPITNSADNYTDAVPEPTHLPAFAATRASTDSGHCIRHNLPATCNRTVAITERRLSRAGPTRDCRLKVQLSPYGPSITVSADNQALLSLLWRIHAVPGPKHQPQSSAIRTVPDSGHGAKLRRSALARECRLNRQLSTYRPPITNSADI